jgi:hypothetical protein
LVAALFAPPLPRVQRNANGKSFLPNRAFGTLERSPDAPCRRLPPRHCLERAKVTLRPISTNFHSSNWHFKNLRLLGTGLITQILDVNRENVGRLSKTNNILEGCSCFVFN